MAGGRRITSGLGGTLLRLLVLVATTHALVLAAPTVVITAPAHTSPTNASPVHLVVTFSEEVSGFGATGIPTELVITGGSFVRTSFFANDALVYHLSVTPAGTLGTLRVVASAAAGTSKSSSEASLESAPFELAYDRIKPSATFTPGLSALPSRVTPILLTLTWSKPITGFDAPPGSWLTRVNVSGGQVTSSSSSVGANPMYALSVVPAPAPAGAKVGAVGITVAAGAATDAASNGNDALTYSHAFDYEAPSPAITSSAANLRSNPIPVVIDWSEAVTPDLTLADVEVTWTGAGAGAATNFRKTAAGQFALDLVPASAAAEAQVRVRAGVVADAAGNANDGTALLLVRYDTVAPAAVYGVLGGRLPTNLDPITVDFNFSKAVTQFRLEGVTLVSGGGR